MKKLILIPAIGLSATYFLKAQGVNIQVYNPVEITTTIAKDSTNFHEYSGTYAMKDNPYIDEVILSVKNNKLVSVTPEGDEVEFQYAENDAFFISAFNAKVKFTRENGIVIGVKVNVQGKEIEGDKKL